MGAHPRGKQQVPLHLPNRAPLPGQQVKEVIVVRYQHGYQGTRFKSINAPVSPYIFIRMNINLAGKAALVTGSVSGIGYGIAKALVSAGANVMIHGFGS